MSTEESQNITDALYVRDPKVAARHKLYATSYSDGHCTWIVTTYVHNFLWWEYGEPYDVVTPGPCLK
jgi:hypothetical protein